MGTYEQGILGPFSGKVGTVVGANWRGKNVMRSRPKKSNRLPSEEQELQRNRFTLVVKFLAPIKTVLSRYFGQAVSFRSRYDLATSYHLKSAVSLVGDAYAIQYNKVLISKGDLQGVTDARINQRPEVTIQLEWADNSGQGLALREDKLLVVIYSPDLNVFEIFEDAAQRDSGEVQLRAANFLQGSTVHCWAGFVDDERKLSSLSVYLGDVRLE